MRIAPLKSWTTNSSPTKSAKYHWPSLPRHKLKSARERERERGFPFFPRNRSRAPPLIIALPPSLMREREGEQKHLFLQSHPNQRRRRRREMHFLRETARQKEGERGRCPEFRSPSSAAFMRPTSVTGLFLFMRPAICQQAEDDPLARPDE